MAVVFEEEQVDHRGLVPGKKARSLAVLVMGTLFRGKSRIASNV